MLKNISTDQIFNQPTAVLLLENGADIYTVSKVLGHKEIRTTQVYAKIVDKKKKEAAYLIPELQIDYEF